MKAARSTGRGQGKLSGSRLAGGAGIPGVAVKCVDIGRNAEAEGELLCQL